MAMAHEREVQRTAPHSTNGRLWFAVAAGPAFWSLHLLLSYPLASLVVCEMGWTWLLHGLSALFAFGTLAGSATGWRAWRAREKGLAEGIHGVGSRPAFMALVGAAFSLLGLVGVLFAWSTLFVTDRCV